MRWQHWAKIVLALGALAVAVAVGLALRRREAPVPPPPVVRSDPKAIVESTGGRAVRFNRAHEDIRVEYERQLTYKDGSTKLLGVKIAADNRGDGRRFVVTGDEGQVAKDESLLMLNGHIKLVEGDGFTVETDAAIYDKRDTTVRAAGPVRFYHNRLSGSGLGMLYEKTTDVLTILDKAKAKVAPDDAGNGAADVTARTIVFARATRDIKLDGGVRVTRGGQTMTAGNGVAHLSMDEKRIEQLDLREQVQIDSTARSAGSLQSMSGQAITLNYAADSEALEHLAASGDAVIQLAGSADRNGRQISAHAIDGKLGPDGQTPVALNARENVQLTLPADENQAARTVRAQTLTATGDPEDPGRGLTDATFTGNVEYREKSEKVDREAHAARLDVGLKAGISAFERASFSGGATFADQRITGSAALVRYDVDNGSLELSGSEPASPRPHVFNDQITVDASNVKVTLAGPLLEGRGDVKSVLQPPKKSSKSSSEGTATKLPSMLKQDEAVRITADRLNYDGTASRATYDGRSQLWQGDTTIKAKAIGIDDKSGDLTAEGSVITTTTVEQTNKDKKTERSRTVATAQSFKYEDLDRKAAYRGGVHLTGAQGDLTAESIDLYLKESGNEVDRAEGFDSKGGLVLREQGRKTVGSTMHYTSADDRYEIKGAPVSITDQCGRVTNGRTLTFRKATDTIEIDGNQRVRTQSRNGDKCQVTTR
jgi:lipopolysaccharide export system protein LptA/lipopolysaccharide export system protein LptC